MRTDQRREVFLGRLSFKQPDHLVRLSDRVIEGRVVAVSAEKQAKRRESRPLIALLEGMGPRNPSHNGNRQHDDVGLAISESVSRACQRPFQQPNIAKKVVLPGAEKLKPIVFDYRFDREPVRLIRQGEPLSSDIGRCARGSARRNPPFPSPDARATAFSRRTAWPRVWRLSCSARACP